MVSGSQSGGSSPLSNIDDYDEEDYQQHGGQSSIPPAKRQRVDEGSRRDTPVSHVSVDHFEGDVSSDTSGDVPNSPNHVNRQDDEDPHHEQVTICAWDGCIAGDLGDMDSLVKHIDNVHIQGRGKKYTCEWTDCSRKSHPHASAYALKAHMRSHTREKPFFCALPECDRSFTRSDALAKHMRTVHETEALRPSDPVPKSNPAAKSNSRLKLFMKKEDDRATNSISPGPRSATMGPDQDGLTLLPIDMFTPEQLALPKDELFRLLRRELQWAEQEAKMLKEEEEALQLIKDREWLEKEILLDQVIKGEMDYNSRRLAVIASMPTEQELRERASARLSIENGTIPPCGPSRDEAAEALASMSQDHTPDRGGSLEDFSRHLDDRGRSPYGETA